MRVVHELENGYLIYYDRGKFDDWCVYMRTIDGATFAPRDEWYFAKLQQFATTFSAQQIYADFVRIYDQTATEISQETLRSIVQMTRAYANEADRVAALLIVIYAGMVAEERKENTRLGKRIKRLGMHQALIEGLPAKVAANFSRGMKWREIAQECERRGF